MVKAYKMLALQALLDAGKLFTGMDANQNAEAALELARRHLLFFRELKDDADRYPFSSHAVTKWKDLPLRVWARGDGTRSAPTSLELRHEARSSSTAPTPSALSGVVFRHERQFCRITLA